MGGGGEGGVINLVVCTQQSRAANNTIKVYLCIYQVGDNFLCSLRNDVHIRFRK